MTVSALERTAVDNLPRCPAWCQLHNDAPESTNLGVTLGPARIHAAVLLDGAVKVTAERYDEVGQEGAPDEFTLHVGDVWIPFTAQRRADLRAVLDLIDAIGVRP